MFYYKIDDGFLRIGPFGANCSEMWIEIQTIFQQDAFEIVFRELAAILCRPRYVNQVLNAFAEICHVQNCVKIVRNNFILY